MTEKLYRIQWRTTGRYLKWHWLKPDNCQIYRAIWDDDGEFFNSMQIRKYLSYVIDRNEKGLVFVSDNIAMVDIIDADNGRVVSPYEFYNEFEIIRGKADGEVTENI